MKRILLIAIAFYTGLCSAAPTTQQWLQSVADTAPPGLATIRAVFNGGAEYIATPTPPVPPPPVFTRITQPADVFHFQQSGGDLEIRKTVVTAGGIVRSTAGHKLTIINSWSEGAPSGQGIYTALIATGPGRDFFWDNSEFPNHWIFSGNEAAVRIMGDTEVATLVGVDICCRMHDTSDNGAGAFDPSEWKKTKLLPIPTINADGSINQPGKIGDKLPSGGKVDWWKGPVQIRDLRRGSATACRFLGPVFVGKQKDPTTPQRVDSFIFDSCGLTNELHLEEKSSYGTIVRKNCFKLEENGRAMKDATGKLVKWPDKTWRGS